MTSKEKWAQIQAFAKGQLEQEILVDGVPGNQTADAVADLLGIDFSVPSKTSSPVMNQAGEDLIKHFESCLKPVGGGKFAAYADPAHGWRVPTIGWGTIQYPDGRMVRKGDVITQAQADAYFDWESAEKANGLAKLLDPTALDSLNDDQFSSLVSFAYNVGLGNFKRSTMRRKINQLDINGAAKEFPRWNRADGEVMKGLTRRRLSEQRLFRSQHPAVIKHI